VKVVQRQATERVQTPTGLSGAVLGALPQAHPE